MSVNGSLSINASVSNSRDDIDLSTPSEKVTENAIKNVTYGKLWHDRVTLLAGDVSAFVFNDGSLEDVYGRTVSLSAINGLYAKAVSTNTSGVFLSGGAGSPINETPILLATQAIAYESDISVSTDGTLYLANSSDALSGEIDIVVIGS